MYQLILLQFLRISLVAPLTLDISHLSHFDHSHDRQRTVFFLLSFRSSSYILDIKTITRCIYSENSSLILFFFFHSLKLSPDEQIF